MLLFIPEFNLQSVNCLAVPAIADYYVQVKSEKDIAQALAFVKEKKLPLLVLGGGSNLVLRDRFPGLVMHIQLLGKQLVREDKDYFYLKAAAGEPWPEFVKDCLQQHFFGIENLSLIPGTVGAAPIQNIGAYGVELKDIFYELSALHLQSGLVVNFDKAACHFGYRDSIFKHDCLDQYIIISVTFQLKKNPELNLEYPALKDHFSTYNLTELSPIDVGEAVSEIRRSKLPDPKEIPNVGSFFKNPVISKSQAEQLKKTWPTLVVFPVSDTLVKLAAAWLIDQAGWKGYCAQACVHEKQALVLTNPHKAPGTAVLSLAEKIKASVFERFGVLLEMEPRVYP